MMGERLCGQERLFYEVCLEDKVPAGHLVRRLDAVLDPSWLRTDVKWNLGLTRLKLRGLTGARDEFLLAATVQNLRRLAKHVIRPPPRPLFA